MIQFTPLALGNTELKNRWIMLAVHTGYGEIDGRYSERDFAFYRKRANGGMSAITLVAAVSKVGAQYRNHRMDSDEYDQGLKKVCDIIHEGGAKVCMQLFHSGRNNHSSVIGCRPWAPSEIASPIYKELPKEMTEEDIQTVIREFADAAVKCKKNGVDIIEISLSAGYLLSQFMSPLTNQRTDCWGGTKENRLRLPCEVIRAVRNSVGRDYPLIIKVSGGDMLGGYDNSLNIDLINSLPKNTIDGVTVTGGWHEAPVPQITYHVPPGGFAHLAKEIKEATGLKVIGCNRINNRYDAERLLEEGYCDFVGAARPFITDPDFINKIRKNIPYRLCQACNRGCIERTLKDKDVKCVFNPHAGNEYLEENRKKPVPRKIMIVGGGPIGMEAAILAAEDGHKVTVVTNDDLGGKLAIVSKPPHKKDFGYIKEYLEYEMEAAGVSVIKNTTAGEDLILKERPDIVFLATGSEPIIPVIDGLDKISYTDFEKVLKGEIFPNKRNIVIIGGGSVGLETAEYMGSEMKYDNISVIEMKPKAGADLGGMRWIMVKNLTELGVNIYTSTKLIKAECDKVIIENGNTEEEISCDLLVFAVGSVRRETTCLTRMLEENGIGYALIGDSGGTTSIFDGYIDIYDKIMQL